MTQDLASSDSSSPALLSQEQEQYLQALSIGHYVVAGLAALFGLIPLLYFVFGLLVMIPGLGAGAAEGAIGLLFGGLIVFMAFIGTALAWVYAFFMVSAGKALVKKERHLLCVVMAALSCMFAPFGTVLGVFSLIVLFNERVREAFGVVSTPQVPGS